MTRITPQPVRFAAEKAVAGTWSSPLNPSQGRLCKSSLPPDTVYFGNGVKLDQTSLALNKLADMLEKAEISDIELQDQTHATLKINGNPYRFWINSQSTRGRSDYWGEHTENKTLWVLDSQENVTRTQKGTLPTRRLVRESSLWGLIPEKWEDVPGTIDTTNILPKISIRVLEGDVKYHHPPACPDDPNYDYRSVLYEARDEHGNLLPISAESRDEEIFNRIRQWFRQLQTEKVFSDVNLRDLEARKKSQLDAIVL